MLEIIWVAVLIFVSTVTKKLQTGVFGPHILASHMIY